jgi:uncharacterized protein (TIGR00251 family)
MAAIEEKDGCTTLEVRVQPRASRNAVRLEADGRIRVALTAPPVEGAANQALTDFIAKSLSLPRGAVTLVRGEKSREKTLRVSGATAEQVRLRLSKGP